MPWKVEKRGSKWAVVKKGTRKVVGMHNTSGEAAAQVRALYANESRSDMKRNRRKRA